jgi:hypothetical protein
MGFKLASHIRGRTKIEGVWEYGPEEIFESMREKVSGRCRMLHIEEIHNLY